MFKKERRYFPTLSTGKADLRRPAVIVHKIYYPNRLKNFSGGFSVNNSLKMTTIVLLYPLLISMLNNAGKKLSTFGIIILSQPLGTRIIS